MDAKAKAKDAVLAKLIEAMEGRQVDRLKSKSPKFAKPPEPVEEAAEEAPPDVEAEEEEGELTEEELEKLRAALEA